jgi:hypothetical protein
MALEPIPAQHDVVIQNQTTGQVDFLQFTGTALTGSILKNYGIGAGWQIVANADFNGDGHPDLVLQNRGTGQLDFMFLDANANLVSSALGSIVPAVHGAGDFGTRAAGQAGPELVSQLPNGQIDLLGFNGSGVLIASDLIANTVGVPAAIGAAESQSSFPIFAGVGPLDSIVTQLANGVIDVLGFSGNFGSGSVTFTNSFTRGTAGVTPPMFAVDQDSDFSLQKDANIGATVNGTFQETVDGVFVNSATQQIEVLSWDSGYNDAAHEGAFLGTVTMNFSLPTGWQVVDAGMVDHVDIFPLT